MLAPDSRSLLLDQLAPLPGQVFDAAVATTFTLDLTATLLPALAFTGFHLAGNTHDPIATLEAVRSAAGRIDVFCQAGAISVPERAPDLLAFVEPMVHPVRPPVAGLFHPKVWFARYLDDEAKPSYRLLVLTRNLTTDASWDLVVRLDSEQVTNSRQGASAALADLVRSLPGRAVHPLDDARQERVETLAAEAEKIVWETPGGVDRVLLHYLDAGRKLSMDLRGSRHLVMSPFLDSTGLGVVKSSGKIEVLSRAEELEKLDEPTSRRLSSRVLDELAVVQEVQDSRLSGQLHAKMYVVEQSRKWSQSHVFVGSANATGAAFKTNTEFMVELQGHRRNLGIDRFLGTGGAFLGLTETYAQTGVPHDLAEDALQRELENAVRRAASVAFTVEVLTAPQTDENVHELRLLSQRPLGLVPGWSATVGLLALPGFAAAVGPAAALDAVVPEVVTGDITPFLTITVESPRGTRASTVVVAQLINSPADRLDVVLARQIDTPEKFLRFLFFLLNLRSPAALVGLAARHHPTGGGGSPFGEGASGVLEMVLGALATQPSALSDLDALVSRLQSTDTGRASLPDNFLDFWTVVRQAADLLRGTTP